MQLMLYPKCERQFFFLFALFKLQFNTKAEHTGLTIEHNGQCSS